MLRLNEKLHYRFAGGGMTSSVFVCVCVRARACACERVHACVWCVRVRACVYLFTETFPPKSCVMFLVSPIRTSNLLYHTL